MRSGSIKMIKVVKESRCNSGINSTFHVWEWWSVLKSCTTENWIDDDVFYVHSIEEMSAIGDADRGCILATIRNPTRC